jgi:hypothetical protein
MRYHMVIDKPAYEELIDYLTSNLDIFRSEQAKESATNKSIEDLIEQELGNQIITLCIQHDELETNHRSIIVREVDGIVYDIQQVLGVFWNRPATEEQRVFIVEYVGLIKNVFDTAIANLID